MSTSSSAALNRRNYLAIASLVFGILGFLVALTAPIPFVPIVSAFTWPFGICAISFSRLAAAKNDPRAEVQARWGLRLGCLGWLIQLITSVVKWTIFIGLVGTALSTYFGLQPTPIP